MSVAIVGDEVRYSYVFALAGRTGSVRQYRVRRGGCPAEPLQGLFAR